MSKTFEGFFQLHQIEMNLVLTKFKIFIQKQYKIYYIKYMLN